VTASSWTPETEEVLRDLWAQGVSASIIATKIATTRNAVIGKAHRLGLNRRRPPQPPLMGRHAVVRAARRTRKKEERKMEDSVPDPMFVEDERPPRGPLTIIELGYDDCRWPVASDFRGVTSHYCGERRHGTDPYCAEHCRRAYHPLPRRV
jgi:GcrA cell cycle regulator